MTMASAASWKKFFITNNKPSSLYYDSGIGADVSQVTSSNLTTSVISSSSPNNYNTSNEIIITNLTTSSNNNNTITNNLAAIGAPQPTTPPTARLKSLKNSAQISSAANLKSARDFFSSNEVTKPADTTNMLCLNSLNNTNASGNASVPSSRKFQSGTLNVNILRKLNNTAQSPVPPPTNSLSTVNAISSINISSITTTTNNENGKIIHN